MALLQSIGLLHSMTSSTSTVMKIVITILVTLQDKTHERDVQASPHDPTTTTSECESSLNGSTKRIPDKKLHRAWCFYSDNGIRPKDQRISIRTVKAKYKCVRDKNNCYERQNKAIFVNSPQIKVDSLCTDIRLIINRRCQH